MRVAQQVPSGLVVGERDDSDDRAGVPSPRAAVPGRAAMRQPAAVVVVDAGGAKLILPTRSISFVTAVAR